MQYKTKKRDFPLLDLETERAIRLSERYKQADRDLEIYKAYINEDEPLRSIAERFDLWPKYVHELITKMANRLLKYRQEALCV